ncbi:MAG: hypothetical protein H7A23_24835 [Leptospiraceae bacterium]|nr:hypothetical protein [Leptospiraceae bacterium]MCP5497792.1 hypothetical protein [Leptospiraceae bacterium]
MSNLSKNKISWVNVFILTISIVSSLFVVEILSRFIIPPPPTPQGVPYFYNFIDKEIYKLGLMNFHEELGWVSKPDTRGYSLFGEFQSFDSMGNRNNDNYIPLKEKPLILAIGDSYTFGSEINNNETWPSQLENSLGIKVINGGVGGYGFGQMLTRTKGLLEELPVDILIVAITKPVIDTRVKQIVRHGIPKPYYSIQKSGNLVLHKVSQNVTVKKQDFFKYIFGYSYTLHLMMSKFYPSYWLADSIYDMQYLDINEVEISYKIFDEFEKLVKRNIIQHFVLALLPTSAGDVSLRQHPVSIYAKTMAEKNDRIYVVDIQLIFSQKQNNQPIRNFFNDTTVGYHGHYNKEGAKLVAETLTSYLYENKIISMTRKRGEKFKSLSE